MANEAKTETPTSERISVGIEQDTTAVSFDGRGNTSSTQTGDSLNTEFNEAGEALTPEDLSELEGEQENASAEPEATSEEANEETSEEETSEAPEEIPEWNGEDEAVSAAYDAKYITKDDSGADVLNFEAFNEEFGIERPQEDGTTKRDLNPGTRQFLKERFGISDKLIDSHLAGVLAQEKIIADTFYGSFGPTPEEGKKVYTEMFSWAKANYSEQQKARFNTAMKEGGEAAQEQTELLKTRFLTKNPGKTSTENSSKPGIGLRKERGVSPKKNATSGETARAQAAQPFANAEEHRRAQNEALQLKGSDRENKLAEVRKRLEASTFWRA